jgi:hypothetical protein
MNLFSNVWALWYQIVCWPVVQAPKFRNGQIATLVTGAVSVSSSRVELATNVKPNVQVALSRWVVA